MGSSPNLVDITVTIAKAAIESLHYSNGETFQVHVDITVNMAKVAIESVHYSNGF